ncbi:MAG: chitobiase/beta-hexosaminidase C-terminal domain-containing protein, partial [Prevotella sp.]|nr:chitobiase/beta-hexosaminidase C-terminal domain-containing protein [Prevotella sp.]
ESTKAPFGFATLSSRTEKTAYNITGGGAYTVSDVKALVAKVKAAGGSAGSTMTVDGKKVIVLEADGTKTDMASTIKTAIESNDIIVFDGDHSLMGEKETGKTNFYVDAFITLSGLSGKTIIGMNGARLCTTWYLTDIIKSWLNSVETSSGSGVSNASTAAGTGGTIVVNGKEIAIDEEGEYLTRKTLVEKGEASKAKQDAGESLTAQDEENIKFLLTEAYRRSGVFYITNCSNLIIRNLSFQGPGSVDVGGYDLVAIINGTNHVWVDHCEFIDGQDGNFDITNESDFITTSWCHFHYTDRSYVHQNTNLVGSNDKYDGKSGETIDDTGKLNITFAYNEWGENCRSRMPMARFGKIHMLNNWYNCPGNTENAINPRKQSEFLIEGNYFVSGITKTFKASEATGISASDNTLVDPAATSINASGSAVTVPYTYGKVASAKVPDMVELLVGPILDKEPNYTVYPKASDDATINTQYDVEVTATEAESGLTFSVWADNAMTYQWYSNTTASEEGATPIEGATRNAYTYRENSEGSIYLYCVATGVGGVKRSNFIHVTIKGTGAPKFFTNLKKSSSYIYDVILGTNYSTLRVDAGNNVTYQWYKNTSAASTTGAVAIDGATSATYTIDASERVEKGSEYYYCVATRPDGSYSSTSNIARVRFVSGSYIIKWKADKDTPKAGDADLNGIENKGTASYAAQDGLGVLKLGNGPSGAETNGFKLTANDGFQVGDVITFAGFINHASNKAHARLVIIKNSAIVDLYNPGVDFVNKNGNASAEPVDYSYTIKAGDLDDTDGSIYVAREGGTGCYLTKIYVSRGNMDDANPPVYVTNLNSTYNTTVGSAVSLEVKMEEEAKSYAWYVSTTEDGEGNPQTGETDSSFSYTPNAEGTTYVYCVVTNGAGIYAKTLKSVVAAVTAKAKTDTDTYIWDVKDWTDMAKDKSYGEGQDFQATGYPDQIITYYGDVKQFSDVAHKYDEDFTSTKAMRTNGATDAGGGKYRRYLKYHAPRQGKITIYVHGINNDSARKIYINTELANTEGAAVSHSTANTEENNNGYFPLEFNITGESDIYVWNTGGGIEYCGIKVELKAVEKKKVEITQDWVFTEEAGWGAQNITSDKTVNGLTAVVAADNTVDIDANKKKLGDESFTMRLKLGATGSSTNRCLKFDVLGPTVIDVWAMSSSSSTDRPLYYKFGDADAVKFTNGDLNGSSLQKVTANYTGKTPTTVYIYSGNGGINVYGIKAVSTVEDDGAPKCKTPTATKGAYVAGSGYKYTIATATVIAKLRYTIGSGAEQTTTLPSAEILVPLGTSVSVKAVDLSAESPKTDSETLTFTGDATMPKVTAPTVAIGKYSFTTHKFPVTITSSAGGTIHYTTDGTTPTASSPTYSAEIGVAPSATVKAMVVKANYSNSNVTEA